MSSPYRDGWGVHVEPIWSGEDEPEHVSDIEVALVQLAPTAEHIVGGRICARVWQDAYVPMGNFQPLEDLTGDDTHDLRSRWFASRSEAEEYAAYVERRWRNPAPWESFVQV